MADTPLMQRRAFLEQRIDWNRKNIESLVRDRRRMPVVLGLLVLTIPAGAYYGWVGVLLVFFGTFATLGTGYYLTWGHQSEYQQKIDDLLREMAEVEAEERAEKMRRLTESP